MKKNVFLSALLALFLSGCSQEMDQKDESATYINKSQDPDFISYFPFGGGLLELHGRRIHDEYLGGGKRKVFCTRPKDDCIEFHRVRNGIRIPLLEEDMLLELDGLAESQIQNDIVQYFSNGNGVSNFAFLKQVSPEYYDALETGTKTIIKTNSGGLNNNTYFIVDYGISLAQLDLSKHDYYAFQF